MAIPRHPLLAAGFLTVLVLPAAAAPQPAAVFGDHMVLQRDMPVPVWGTAAPGEEVTVRFRDQAKTAKAGADGKWLLKLDPLRAGGPDELRIGPLALTDVLVGEVWVGSGQSNMGVGTGGAAKADPMLAKIAAGNHPSIRIGSAQGKWRAATNRNTLSLAALPLAFAVPLQQALGVPVGMVLGSVGGSSTEFWLTPGHLNSDPACRTAMERYAKEILPGLKQRHARDVERWQQSPRAADPQTKPPPPAEPGASNLPRHIVGKLFEEHIRPAIPFAIRGVLWDQGENLSAAAGPNQTQAMNALIQGWRRDWGQGAFPWVFVQKPSGGGGAWNPGDPFHQGALPFAGLPDRPPGLNEGRYREFFLRILRTPNTAMALASDLSPGVHPPMKSSYGARAANAALVLAYGRKLEIYGPLYAGHQLEGPKVRIRFSHTGQGLACKGGDKLQGFMIAGKDRKFQWADASIDGQTVVVSSPAVAAPESVRYAWSDKCPWANLFNNDGLPAQAFRTDEW